MVAGREAAVVVAAENLRDFPPVEENIERPDSLRQSLLKKHDCCPRSAYLMRRYETASIPMDRGTAFHQTVERAIELMMEQGEPKIPGEVARELADAVMAERTDLVLPTREQDAVRLMAWNWAEGFLLDPKAVVGVEVPVELEVGGFTLTGTIDLLEAHGQTLYIHDWKTSLNIRKREEVQRGFQGQFYGLACLEGVHAETKLPLGTGINDVWFYETYPRYRDKDSGALVAKEGSWTRSELHEFRISLERNVTVFERALETGDWPARSGSWCAECPAPTECPIPERLRQLDSIGSVAEAEAMFEKKIALERDSRRVQSSLRGWADPNGPIYAGDYAFDGQDQQTNEVKDWDLLDLAINRSAEFGVPFKREDHIRPKRSVRFAKRKLTPEELEERDVDKH